jgi:hypothetical protein
MRGKNKTLKEIKATLGTAKIRIDFMKMVNEDSGLGKLLLVG